MGAAITMSTMPDVREWTRTDQDTLNEALAHQLVMCQSLAEEARMRETIVRLDALIKWWEKTGGGPSAT
jgi:hypothetical protein